MIETIKVKTAFGGQVFLKLDDYKKAKAGKRAFIKTVRKDGTPTQNDLPYHVKNLILNQA